MAFTSPRTWVAGEVVTNNLLNTHVRDNLRYLKGLDGEVVFSAYIDIPNSIAGQGLYHDGTSIKSVVRPGMRPGTLAFVTNAGTGSSTAGTLTKIKETQVYQGGGFRVDFDLGISGAGTAFGQIFKNGTAIGTLRSSTAAAYDSFTEDVYQISGGDLVQLYVYRTVGGTALGRNFNITVEPYSGGSSIL